MARPRKGAYVALKAQYYLDDAVLEAGPDAELLWVRILSFLASVRTDGRISQRQLQTVGYGLRNVKKRAERLQEVGLLLQDGDSYEARSWQKWNRSTQEIDNYLAAERERKAQKHAGNDDNSGRNGDEFRPDSALSTVQSSPVQYREPNGSLLLSDSDESDRDGELLSPDWIPSKAQYDKAISFGLNPEQQLKSFRAHAERNQRRQKNWNTAFTNWLKKGAELAQQRQASGQAIHQGGKKQSIVEKTMALTRDMSFGGLEIEA